MNLDHYLWLAFAAVCGSWALFAAFSRLEGRSRIVATALLPLMLYVSYAYGEAFRGTPDGNDPKAADLQVLTAFFEKDVAIYVLTFDGQRDPHLYRLAWSDELADELSKQLADRDADRVGTIHMRPGELHRGTIFEADPPVTDGMEKDGEESAPKVAE